MRASGGCHAFCFREARRSVLTIAAACLTAFTLFQASPLAAQPEFPEAAGHVNDFAGVLDDASRKELEALLVTLETDTTAEVALATVSSLEGISVEEYATRMFNTWGVGQADKDNGVLILVAPSEREMRIEVGYGLEAVMPDGLAGSIIRNEFVPSFRDGNYQTGIVAGVRRVAAIVRRGEHVTESQLQALARAEEGARAIVVPSWIVIAVFALLVAGGGYMVGLGGGSKVIGILVVGAIVAGLGLTLSWLYSLSGFVAPDARAGRDRLAGSEKQPLATRQIPDARPSGRGRPAGFSAGTRPRPETAARDRPATLATASAADLQAAVAPAEAGNRHHTQRGRFHATHHTCPRSTDVTAAAFDLAAGRPRRIPFSAPSPWPARRRASIMSTRRSRRRRRTARRNI